MRDSSKIVVNKSNKLIYLSGDTVPCPPKFPGMVQRVGCASINLLLTGSPAIIT